MKKHIEKQPVDDLFARRLKNISLPPNPDGFARLQARMGQEKPEMRVVFWRNPAIQQYMAVAASLVLMCLFGWLYLSTNTSSTNQADVAGNEPRTSSVQELTPSQPADNVAVTQPGSERATSDQGNSKATAQSKEAYTNPIVNKPANDNRQVARIGRSRRETNASSDDELPTNPLKPMEQVAQTEPGSNASIGVKPIVEPVIDKPMAVAVNKSAPVAERVLVVTIAEPEALASARRAINAPVHEEVVAIGPEKPEKETKAVGLWQQMKRIKQGEILARKDTGEDERGLLGRAYSSLKQTLDKDKPVRQ